MGSKTGLEYDVEFKKSRKNVIEGTDFGKGAINLDTLPSFKRLLAKNLASWMDKYSEGSTKNEWLSDHNRMREFNTKGGELKVSESDLDIQAVEAFFGPSNDVEISKMVEGGSKYGLLGDYGMDFPGHGIIGTGATEENAEEYMLQTYKLWNILNNIESDEDIQMPSVDNVVNPHDPHGYYQPIPIQNPSLFITGNYTLTEDIDDSGSGGVILYGLYSGSYTATRHNYIQLNNLGAAGATITDACVFRFNQNAGTHKAVDSGSAHPDIDTTDAWIKVNINDTIHYIPCYTDKS